MLADRISRIFVESAGTYVGVSPECLGSPAHPHAVECMTQRKINITNHHSRPLSALCIKDYDLIICMSEAELDYVAKLRPRGAILLANATGGGIPNPWEKGKEAYRHCAAILAMVADEVVRMFL
jgi:protein-tyrosine-phosphatase